METLQSCSTISTVRDMSSTIELHTTEKNGKEEKTESDGTQLRPLETTDLEALLHVIKSSLGSGVLAMPVAFKNAGLLLGLIGTIFVGVICTHGTHLLVHSSQKMCYALKKKSLGYADTVEAVFNTTPHIRVKCYASLARKAVNVILFFTYFGTTATYVVIVASTLQEVTKDQFEINWNVRWFMVISVIPLLIVGTIRSMKYLVPFSLMANALLFIGVVITFYYLLQDIPPLSSRPMFVQLSKFPMFFSIVLCGLEGIGTILPIENSMRKPHHFLGFPGVLLFAMPIVVSLFTSIGFFGYLKYGDSVHGSITLSLPQTFLAESIKMLVGLAVLFTYGLQMTAVMEVVWNLVKDKIKKENHACSYYFTRSLLVLGSVLCAIAVPQLAPALSLLGAIGFSFLGLFVPAVVDLILISEDGFKLLHFTTLKDFFLIVLSVFALVTGSYVSIIDIISEYL